VLVVVVLRADCARELCGVLACPRPAIPRPDREPKLQRLCPL